MILKLFYLISTNQSSELHFSVKIKEKLLFHKEQPEEKWVFLPKYDVQSENDIALWKAELICYTLRLIRIEFSLLKYALRTIFIFPPKFKFRLKIWFCAELRHFLPDDVIKTTNLIQANITHFRFIIYKPEVSDVGHFYLKPEVKPEVNNYQHNDDVII